MSWDDEAKLGFLLLVPPFTKTCMSGSFVSPFGSPFQWWLINGLLSDGPDRGGGEWSAWRWDIPGARALWLCTRRVQISILVSNLIVSRYLYTCFWESNGLKDRMFSRHYSDHPVVPSESFVRQSQGTTCGLLRMLRHGLLTLFERFLFSSVSSSLVSSCYLPGVW